LAKAGDRTVAAVARDLGVDRKSLHLWIAESQEETRSASSGLTSAEREELVRLRRENRRLLAEKEILKKAAAFFARESE
jgi:transposase-like protein